MAPDCRFCLDIGWVEYLEPGTRETRAEACPLCSPYWVKPRMPLEPEGEAVREQTVTATGTGFEEESST